MRINEQPLKQKHYYGFSKLMGYMVIQKLQENINITILNFRNGSITNMAARRRSKKNMRESMLLKRQKVEKTQEF